jgi:1-acyl-sn-glycerol-3-phosphate acyltransferase
MATLRSVLFAIYLYGMTVLLVILWIPAVLVLPRGATVFGYRLWGRWSLAGLKFFCGTSLEIRGLENLPEDRAVILACKHQSMWDILALFALIKNPVFISKREILWIPIAGIFAFKAGTITVNRGAAAKALREMIKNADVAMKKGRSVIIFPEGTRKTPGADPDYKSGVAALYTRLEHPCVPVSLNSGVFWPRRKWLRKPGTIVLEFGPLIEPGFDRKSFMATLQGTIEGTSASLLKEARASL